MFFNYMNKILPENSKLRFVFIQKVLTEDGYIRTYWNIVIKWISDTSTIKPEISTKYIINGTLPKRQKRFIIKTSDDLQNKQMNSTYIQPINCSTGLFFESLGQTQISTSDWTLLVNSNFSLFEQKYKIISTGIKEVEEYCYKILKVYFNRTTIIEEEFVKNEHILNCLELLSIMSQNLKDDLTDLLTAILFAKKGILHPALITPRQLISELTSAKIPSGMELPL